MHTELSISVLSGQFIHFNLSPKGVPEGMLIHPDGAGRPAVVQVNFSPELAGQVTDLIDEGDVVTVEVFPFRDAEPHAHPVYDLMRLTTADGQSLTAEGSPEPGVRVEGTVVRINFARRGEANGGLLDTGDFVHLRPHGAKAIGLKLGQKIVAEGEVRAGWSGHRVIEVAIANDITIEKPKHPKHDKPNHNHPKPHGHGPHHGPHHEPGAKHGSGKKRSMGTRD